MRLYGLPPSSVESANVSPLATSVATEMSWLSLALMRLTIWMFSVVAESLLSSCVLNSIATPVSHSLVAGFCGAGLAANSLQIP